MLIYITSHFLCPENLVLSPGCQRESPVLFYTDIIQMLKGDITITVFEEIKSLCTARAAAEYYGLMVGRNKMACCPFHDDHHPSMKIDEIYYCFTCGAKGDAVSYVAQMFGLNQYEAACKLIKDLHLPIKIGKLHTKGSEYWKTVQKKKHTEELRHRFDRWCLDAINLLKKTDEDISELKISFQAKMGMDVLDNKVFCELISKKTDIERWLDILCTGTSEEKMELFIQRRKEVDAYGGRISDLKREYLGESCNNS